MRNLGSVPNSARPSVRLRKPLLPRPGFCVRQMRGLGAVLAPPRGSRPKFRVTSCGRALPNDSSSGEASVQKITEGGNRPGILELSGILSTRLGGKKSSQCESSKLPLKASLLPPRRYHQRMLFRKVLSRVFWRGS